MTEPGQFVDAETYQGKGEEKLTFRMIILETLKKIGTYASVEFRGGYWEERPVGTGQYQTWVKVYVPDTREVYSNSVEYLYDILYPHFDEQMKKAGQEANIEDGKAFHKNTIPDRTDETPEEAERMKRKFKDMGDRMDYRSERQAINRILFRNLNCFLQRQKYMEGKSFTDEV